VVVLLLDTLKLALVKRVNLLLVLVYSASQSLYLILLDLNVKSLLSTEVFEAFDLTLEVICSTYFRLYHVKSLLVVLQKLVFSCQISLGLSELVSLVLDFLLKSLL